MKAIEGSNGLGLDAADMCQVSGVKIHAKFKVPDFENYKGISCPGNHIQSYCRKMTPYSNGEKLLMCFFQDSLNGTSLYRYMQIERTYIKTWRELAEVFLKDYQCNTDMSPNMNQLQSLT